MQDKTKILPPDNDGGLDIGALARTLDKVTNSYKFLWVLGLLNSLPPPNAASLRIPIRRIVMEMLRAADYPIRHYRLSFGLSDKMAIHIADLEKAAKRGDDSLDKNSGGNSAKEKAINDACRRLARFVPQQWLVPFFDGREKMPQRSDAVAAKVREVAHKYFDSDSPPPYCFVEERRGADIEIHPRWFAYFSRNIKIIHGWAMYCWIDYLQARNPNTPGIITKLAHPERRAQIDEERKWWRAMMGQMEVVKCIYSGETLTPDGGFVLDHYVPWSYVGHNRLWNLIPASADANLRKSDRLPKWDKYFDRFVNLQFRALSAYNDYHGRPGKGWGDLVESYAEDLKITPKYLPPLARFSDSCRAVILPLMTLAQNRGFGANWDYDNTQHIPVIKQTELF